MDQQDLPAPARVQEDVAFETLLWELSLKFVELPGEAVDSEIRVALRRCCDSLGLDRSSLWQTDPADPRSLLVTHIYEIGVTTPDVDTRTGAVGEGTGRIFPLALGSPYPAALTSIDRFPWITRRLLDGLTVVVQDLDALPADAAVDVASLRGNATQSTVIVPLRSEDGLLGCVTFATTRAPRAWDPPLVRKLELIGQVFGRALARKRYTTSTREQDAWLTLVADSVGAGFWELDLATRRLRATVAARRLFGLGPDQDLDTGTILAIVHPDDRAMYEARLASFLDHAHSYSQDYRIVLRDGSVRWISSRGQPFAAGPGEAPARVFGMSIDITELKRGEAALRASEAVNRVTFEQAAVGIAHVAPDGSWLRANDKLCEILGYSRDELIGGLTFQDLTHPDSLQAHLESSRAMLAGRLATYSLEKRYVRKDGSTIWANLTVSLVRDEAGGPRHFISIVEDITERKRAEEQLRTALAQLQALRDQLQLENRSLRDEVQRRGGAAVVVGTSAPLRAALALADQVAPTGATVLLLGETGTGKERFANYIHERSPRGGRTMVRVNCAAIPVTLIESELFGRERGAFTGALARQIGRFELANGSTIFLDEIGDLPLEVQVKLLRVIEERCVERLGNPRPVAVDVRIIAATHRDLASAVRAQTFREDLYYRLNVFPIELPPLRDRPEDIPLLARAIVDELGTAIGKRFSPLSHATLQALQQHRWPGNIRELRNVLERAMITSTTATLDVAVPETAAAAAEPRRAGAASALKDVERAHILAVLGQTGWRIRGAYGAAAVLGLPPTTLENRMKRLGISRPSGSTQTRS